MTTRFIIFSLFSLVFTAFAGVTPLLAQEDSPAFRSTPYPLPRFVSLNADEVYVRAGPGQRYPVRWVFKKKDLPVEIILEYENWRKIRDYDGMTGWVHHSLLSGRRSGIIQAQHIVSVYKNPDVEARLVAYVETGTVGALESCEGAWCKIEASGYKGWVERKFIWGVYENENFD